MQAKKASAKRAISTILIILGIIGYIPAAYFFGYGVYLDVTAPPNAAEDQPGGLNGLTSVLEIGAGVVVAGAASILFIPGMLLRSNLKSSSTIGQGIQRPQNTVIQPNNPNIRAG